MKPDKFILFIFQDNFVQKCNKMPKKENQRKINHYLFHHAYNFFQVFHFNLWVSGLNLHTGKHLQII